mgnify:FL=1
MFDALAGCQNQVRLLEQINKELDEDLGNALDKIEELQETLAGLLSTVDDEENRGRGINRFWFTKR